MLKLTTLSDAQSELMQGGRRSSNGHGSSRPSRGSSNGPIRQTTNNIYVGASQDSFAQAFTLGGKNSLAYNDVTQLMNIGISV
jgi:hypothetical protein